MPVPPMWSVIMHKMSFRQNFENVKSFVAGVWGHDSLVRSAYADVLGLR